MNVENKNLLPVITSENDVYPYLKKINQFFNKPLSIANSAGIFLSKSYHLEETQNKTNRSSNQNKRKCFKNYYRSSK